MKRYRKFVIIITVYMLFLAAESILDFLLKALNSNVQVMGIVLTAGNLNLLDR